MQQDLPHAPAEAVAGLEAGTLLHRSRHAETLLATWHGLPVVAKVVRGDLQGSRRSDAASSIRSEGLLLQRFDHPSIVRVVDVVTDPAVLVLELARGRTLREELRQRRRMPAAEVARAGAQLADALAHLHRHWVMHRDVKPANILYDGDRAVLVDFHLAREPGPMRGGAGTRLFAAPEQVLGGHVTPAADMWGLGVVLYRASSGRLPFHSDDGHPQLTRRATPVLERLAHSRFGGDADRAASELPSPLADLVDSLLHPEPAARPTADEVREALQQAAA